MPIGGDPAVVYAITVKMTGYADLMGGPGDPDRTFTGKVISMSNDGTEALMECYDKDKFDTVWVYLPEGWTARIGDEYSVTHTGSVDDSNPPRITPEHLSQLSTALTTTTPGKISVSQAQAIIESRLPEKSYKYYLEDNGEEEIEGREYHRFRVYTRGSQPIDDDGTYMYFTYAWAYVDILTGKLYEYDMGKLELIPWDKEATTSATTPSTTTSGTTASITTITVSTTTTTTTAATTTTTTASTTNTTTGKTTMVNENLPKVSENKGLYRVDREWFQEFLSAPSFNIIKDCVQSPVVNMAAVDSVGEHPFFMVYQPLVDLVSNEEYLTSFLQKNGVREKIVGAVSLTSVGMPFTLWVQTERRNVFVTIETTGKIPDDGDPYTFTVLSQEQYAEKYLWREAALIVNNQVVSAGRFAPALVCESRALIPFKTILEACGVNLVYKDFGQGKRYVVGGREFEIGSWDYEDTFRIYEMRGEWGDDPMTIPMISQLRSEDAPNTTIRYVVFDEIIVDNIYLKTLLEYMFKDAQISVEYSRENATIEISVK